MKIESNSLVFNNFGYLEIGIRIKQKDKYCFMKFSNECLNEILKSYISYDDFLEYHFKKMSIILSKNISCEISYDCDLNGFSKRAQEIYNNAVWSIKYTTF